MINNNYNVGIYLRLSKEDEKKGESTSISNQREIINKYINENKLLLISEYIDDGVSGTTFERMGFQKMINDIEKKKINMVITKDLSRFGRNEGQQLRYLDYFYENNIRYVSILDNVDTFDENNTSNEMIPIQCFFNEKHVRDTSKKMKASVYNKRIQGNFLGSSAPYGYKKDPNNKYKLIIDNDSSKIVKRIFNLFISGNSICQISRILTNENIPIPSEYKKLNRGIKSTAYGIWNTRTISDILKLPTYMGSLTQGRLKKPSYKSKKIIRNKKEDWIICENACPQIISKEVFELAQSIYNKNKFKTKNNQILLFKGMVYCKECGHTIGFRICNSKTKKGNIIRCYGNCNYWIKHKKYNLCTPHNIKYFELEKLVIQEIKKNITKKLNYSYVKSEVLKKCNRENNLNELESRLKKINRMLEFTLKKKENLYNDKLEGIIDINIYKNMCERISNEYIKYEKEIKEIENKIEFKKNKQSINEYEKIINNFYKTKINSREFISSIVEKIEIDENNNINIFYKFKSLNEYY